MDRLISEKAVLDAFREHQGSISDFYKTIKAIPSAEPQTGHWIKVYEAIGLYRWKCDKCKKHHRAMYDYCPSCGARMVEPQERSDKE